MAPRGHPVADPAERFWVQTGEQARVLVVGRSIEVVVYWEEAEVPGFYWFSRSDPERHHLLQAADEITPQGWETACELASREHFEPLGG